MKKNLRFSALALVLTFALALSAAPALAQSLPGWGRVSLFGMLQSVKYDDGTTRSVSELSAGITIKSKTADDGGIEYGVDARGSTYPGTGRDSRSNVYEAWVGGRTKGGVFTLRLGQMYLTELGALGSFGGLMAEAKIPGTTPLGRLRFGLFGGLEPRFFDIGFVSDVKKAGVWAALDGEVNRHHVLGWVILKKGSLTE